MELDFQRPHLEDVWPHGCFISILSVSTYHECS